MHARTEVGRLLHQEHLRAFAVLDRLQAFIDATSDAVVVSLRDAEPRQVVESLHRFLVEELESHLDLEDQTFPLLEVRGAFELTSIFSDEHACIRPISRRVRALCALALEDGFDPETWHAFRSFACVLVTELTFHIEREETSLLPAIDNVLDAATDRKLAVAYRRASAVSEGSASRTGLVEGLD